MASQQRLGKGWWEGGGGGGGRGGKGGGGGGGGHVCYFLLTIRDIQKIIDQLVKIPNKRTPFITWSSV